MYLIKEREKKKVYFLQILTKNEVTIDAIRRKCFLLHLPKKERWFYLLLFCMHFNRSFSWYSMERWKNDYYILKVKFDLHICIIILHLLFFVASSIRFLPQFKEFSVQLTFREEWNDDRLVYDDEDGQLKYLTLTEPDRIWKPDLFFRNEKDGHFHEIIMPNVLLRIWPNGTVLFSLRISLILSCPMDLKYYPMDLQRCVIEMASCELIQ